MFTGNEDHRITLAEGKEMTKRFRDQTTSGEIIGGFFAITQVVNMLNQDDCVGFRYYYGLDANNKKVMVLVGTDANENDQVNGLILERAFTCPNRCGNLNDLNGDI